MVLNRLITDSSRQFPSATDTTERPGIPLLDLVVSVVCFLDMTYSPLSTSVSAYEESYPSYCH